MSFPGPVGESGEGLAVRAERLSYAYPGRSARALEDVEVACPRGAVAAAAGGGPEPAVWLAAGGLLAGLAAGTWALAPTLVGRLTGRGRTL